MTILSDKRRFENVDYKFRDDLIKNINDFTPIEILVEPYKGIVYHYENVILRGEEHNQLGFTVIFVQGEADLKDPAFVQLAGDILLSIFIEGKDYNESRKDNLKKSRSKRQVRTKSPAVSEN